MKESGYNFFVKYEPDNILLGYNCVSGGLLVFPGQQHDVINKILENPDKVEDSIIKEKLIKGRFLIDDDLDEIQLLKFRNNTARFNPNGLGMVITPTLLCNFDCPYCYVDRERVAMSPETVAKMKLFFDKKIEHIGAAAACWSGGEPILAIDTVEELNNYFRKKSLEEDITFSSSVITNGYLLSPEIVERLTQCGISVLQITIDGYREHHNRFRRTQGGQDTYEKILENVIYASKKDFKIILRSNIQKENYQGVYQLIDELADSDLKKDNILYVPCNVMAVETNRGHYCGNCFSNEEFSAIEPEILEYSMNRGFKLSKHLLSTTSTFCGANSLTLFVIDAYANVMKCWCNLGRADKNMTGSIGQNGEINYSNHKNILKWMSWDPFDIDECKKCRVLPACMGGCMYHNVMGETDEIGVGCSQRKYNLSQMMKLYYEFCKRNGHAKLQDIGLLKNKT
ncbi:MAG: radical SAM protein [Candidatus Aminicenantes bacterium]|nr:radical SAM protein [Candidatus Aminicenantes bacterium]